MKEVFGPYPGDEFMWVLEGQVSMIDSDGNATEIKQGQTFCVRNAIPVRWKQVGFLRKFYMTYADPKAVTPKITSAEGGVALLDAAAKMTKLNTTEPLVMKGPISRFSVTITFLQMMPTTCSSVYGTVMPWIAKCVLSPGMNLPRCWTVK